MKKKILCFSFVMLGLYFPVPTCLDKAVWLNLMILKFFT